MKITFVIPSRNNLEFLKLCYSSIRNLKTPHDILILDDASIDGTKEWLSSLEDSNLLTFINPGPDRIGIVGMFDKGIHMSRTEVFIAFHADMVACKDLDLNILKNLSPKTVVCATRVEPPLHPSGPEKITRNFGVEVEEFDLENWYRQSEELKEDRTTEGVFAPWCMYKKDFLEIGGHDPLFAPQSKEDSDLFNRFFLNGYKLVQSWDSLVYHFTSRGSRFNKFSGGSAGNNSEEWLYTTNKNAKNFIRKWGSQVLHDSFMKPIVPPKYNIGIRIKKASMNILRVLEPWCDKLYVDDETGILVNSYCKEEQQNTTYNLTERIYTVNTSPDTDILIDLDNDKVDQQDINTIIHLPFILSNELLDPGKYVLGNLIIEIKGLQTYERNLITLK